MAVRELTSLPNTLTLYAKAVAGAPTRKGGNLPDLELVLAKQIIDKDHLTKYNRVCGFTLRDVVPSTYLHVLTFPLQMMLMTDSSFPFALMGLVHVRNRIDQLRPVRSDEVLTFRTRVNNLQSHDKGVTFDLVSEAFVGDVKVWIDVSTYLRRQKSTAAGEPSAEKPNKKVATVPAPSATWIVPSDIGRRYGAVSGDRNPIHLYAITARLLGFPQAIAHGMWSKAACLAALDGRLPDAYSIDVQFKLPVLLPA
ncbi:MAG: MaoC/PaaZ C-terminal domain-containing protein, partial [Moraxellaceae bacterium]|nr:MaoC/PaaZ C-terminal domain-containing protein [Moraxellaceae bacterium]